MTRKWSCEWCQSIGLLRVYISTDFKFCFKGPFAKNSPERQKFVKKCKETGVKITLFPIDFNRTIRSPMLLVQLLKSNSYVSPIFH
jgi:hypothetical protein